MKRLAQAVSFALLSSAAVTAQPPLEALFQPGFLVEDRNGDGLADFVNAELVLGNTPSSATVAAASDIAARLGFETMAMNLPLTEEHGRMGVAVGAEAASALGDEFTDDAALCEYLGYGVKVVSGSPWNIKITTPDDLQVARCLIEAMERV